MNNMISGYIVVRKTDGLNVFVNERPLSVEGIFYHGFERDSFCDISSLYLDKKLSNPYLDYYLEARANDDGYIGPYCKSYFSASLLLEYSNRLSGSMNEIIAFEMENKEKFFYKEKMSFIGVDILFFAGSLLYEGVFLHPELFEKYIKRITNHGLFPEDEKLIQEYIDDYCILSESHFDILEPATKNDIKGIVKIWLVT